MSSLDFRDMDDEDAIPQIRSHLNFHRGVLAELYPGAVLMKMSTEHIIRDLESQLRERGALDGSDA